MASFDSLVNGTQTLAMCTMMLTGPEGNCPRDWDNPYERQLLAITDCVMAQAAGWNCKGTRLAYLRTCMTWPSDRFTFFIAAWSRLMASLSSFAGVCRGPIPASDKI